MASVNDQPVWSAAATASRYGFRPEPHGARARATPPWGPQCYQRPEWPERQVSPPLQAAFLCTCGRALVVLGAERSNNLKSSAPACDQEADEAEEEAPEGDREHHPDRVQPHRPSHDPRPRHARVEELHDAEDHRDLEQRRQHVAGEERDDDGGHEADDEAEVRDQVEHPGHHAHQARVREAEGEGATSARPRWLPPDLAAHETGQACRTRPRTPHPLGASGSSRAMILS